MWISTAEWYGTAPVSWFVHAVAAGIPAAVLYLVLAHVRLLAGPDRSGRDGVVGRTMAIGLVVGGVWEAYRWFDSVATAAATAHPAAGLLVYLLVDLAGALVAGVGLAALAHGHADQPATGTLRAVVAADPRGRSSDAHARYPAVSSGGRQVRPPLSAPQTDTRMT